jgi:1,4-alpha-glucan branching enzyme
VPRPNYRVGVPVEGIWVEALNTNSKKYGGNGDGNLEPVKTQPIKWDGGDHAVDLFLPGITTLFFLLKPPPAAVK